jgi:hypothetical protein
MATGITGRSQRAVTAAHKQMMKNLGKEISRIQGVTLKGLIQAVQLIKADAVKNAPKKTGYLRSSGYVIWQGADGTLKGEQKDVGDDVKAEVLKGGKIIKVSIGFGANYAIYVHETNKNYVVGTWKFLTKSIANNQQNVIRLIKYHAKKELK